MIKPLLVTLTVTACLLSVATSLSPRFRARRQAGTGANPLVEGAFLGNDVSQFTLHSHDHEPNLVQDTFQDAGEAFAKSKDDDLEVQLLAFLEEQKSLSGPRQPNEDDFTLNGVGFTEETFPRGQDAEEAGLVTLADHLDKEHFSPDTFRPSVRSCFL